MLMTTAAVMLAVMTGCASTPDCDTCEDNPMATAGLYRHVVVFRYKKDATDEQIQQINEAFAKLPEQIDTIRGYEWGTNVSPENLADGFTHCYLVTFDSADDIKGYLPHPAHQAFVKKLRPILDKAFVIDYVAKNN
ncbi:Dabb family protein [Planctomycetales bacterium ZRK34]|nr:Dabb family protein [Planctomycetales bacterium ZRK34]